MDKKAKQWLTIPNILSFFRILLIPLIVWLYYVQKQYGLTIAVLVLSGLTDIVDGFIARKFNMISDVGKILDPIADKLTQGVTILCMTTRFPLMWLLFISLMLKEILMGVMGIIVIRKTGVVNGAKWHGKVTTCMIYVTMIVHIIYIDITSVTSNLLIVFCIAIILTSFVLYNIGYAVQIKRQKTKKDINDVINDIAGTL